jgi:tetratricopeptide (TPR) repeat protein
MRYRVIQACFALLACITPALGNTNLDLLLFEAMPIPAAISGSGDSAAPASVHAALPATAKEPGPGEAGLELEGISALDRLRTIQAYTESANLMAAELGPFDPGMFQKYLSLGLAQQELGQHEEAIKAFEAAEHISRVNDGLNTPMAIAPIEAAILSHVALGDMPTANRRLQYLLLISRNYYGSSSIQLVPLLSSMGDWYMDTFLNSITSPPEPTISINIGNGMQGQRMDPRRQAFGNLFRAQGNYYQAINNLLNNGAIRSPALLELEKNLVETYFLNAHRESLMRSTNFFVRSSGRVSTGSHVRRNEFSGYSRNYLNGRHAYERMRYYQQFQQNPDPLEQAQIIVGQGDWNLLFGHHALALRTYHEALELLQVNKAPQEHIDALFSPQTPQNLPLFSAVPHSRTWLGLADTHPVEYEGHIDVSFELSRYGKARKIKVLDRQGLSSPDIERRLRRLLTSTRFRPDILPREDSSNPVHQVRYNFAFMEPRR